MNFNFTNLLFLWLRNQRKTTYEKGIYFNNLYFVIVNDIYAQTGGYLLLKNNAKVEMSMYNKKGNTAGKVIYKMLYSNGTEAKVNLRFLTKK